MMAAEDLEAPVQYRTREASSSFTIAGFKRSGFTSTRSAPNSIMLHPPKAAAYWSWRPPASPQSMRSIWKAIEAISYSLSGSEKYSRKPSINATTRVDDEPRPEPGGASAQVVIVRAGSPSAKCWFRWRYTAAWRDM